MYFRPAFTYVHTCQYWSPRRHSELDSSASVEKMSRVHKVNVLCIYCSVHKPMYMHCTYCIAGNVGEGFNLAPNLKVVNIIIIAKSMFFAHIFLILLSAAMFLTYKMVTEQQSHYDRGTKPLRSH